MPLEHRDRICASLSDYYATDVGHRLQAALDDLFADCLKDVIGHHAVVLQCAGAETDWLSYSSIGCTVDVGPCGRHIRAGFDELPIDTESVSLVIAYHALDFPVNRNNAVGEIHRILVPEGRLVVISFNPLRRVPEGMAGMDRQTMYGLLATNGFAIRARHYVGAPLSLVTSEHNEGARHGAMWRVPDIARFVCRPLCRLTVLHADKKVTGITPVRPAFKRAMIKARTAGVSGG